MTTPEPTPEAVEALARIHGQHRYVDVRGDYEVGDGRRYFGCSCGWTHDVDGMSGYWSWVEEHERHAARAVLAAGYREPRLPRGQKSMVESRIETLKAENERLQAQVDELQEGLPAAYGGEHDRRRAAEAKVERQRRVLAAAERAAKREGATGRDVKDAMDGAWERS